MISFLKAAMVISVANAMCTISTCTNGYCTGGNVCKCRHGFMMGPYGRCLPYDHCTQATCQNGYCSPRTLQCTCWNGFVKDQRGNCVQLQARYLTGFAEPPRINRCNNETCVNGHCDPVRDECRCNEGYFKSSTGKCLLSGFGNCRLNCHNGQCAKLINYREVCYCNEGFQRDPNNYNNCVKQQNTGGTTSKNNAAAQTEQEVEYEQEAGPSTTSSTTPTTTIRGQHWPYAANRFNPRFQQPPSTTQTPPTTTTTVPNLFANMEMPSFDSPFQEFSGFENVPTPAFLNNRIMSMMFRLLSLRKLIDALL